MGAHQHIVQHAEIGEDAAVLEGARQAERGQPFGGQAGDVAATQPRRAGVGLVEPGHEVEQRRLAGTVGADDADELALRDVEIDIVDGRQTAEPAREAANLEQWHGCRHIVPIRPCGRKRTSRSRTRP